MIRPTDEAGIVAVFRDSRVAVRLSGGGLSANPARDGASSVSLGAPSP